MILADLIPRLLATDARAAAERSAARLAFALAGGAEFRPPREDSRTDLELIVEALVLYAQCGHSGSDWGDDAESAADALLSLHGALYRSPADEDAGELPRAWLADGADPLALVARAVLARVSIARGHGVRRAHLAALAGVSGPTLRGLVAEGRLVDQESDEEREGGGKPERPVTAESARAWLAARGVPGFREEK